MSVARGGGRSGRETQAFPATAPRMLWPAWPSSVRNPMAERRAGAVLCRGMANRTAKPMLRPPSSRHVLGVGGQCRCATRSTGAPHTNLLGAVEPPCPRNPHTGRSRHHPFIGVGGHSARETHTASAPHATLSRHCGHPQREARSKLAAVTLNQRGGPANVRSKPFNGAPAAPNSLEET